MQLHCICERPLVDVHNWCRNAHAINATWKSNGKGGIDDEPKQVRNPPIFTEINIARRSRIFNPEPYLSLQDDKI